MQREIEVIYSASIKGKLPVSDNLLLRCIIDTDGLPSEMAEFTADSSIELLKLARRQQILPFVYYHLLQLQTKQNRLSTILPQLQRSFYDNATRNLRLMQELSPVLARLATHNIPVILLKGAHLVAGVYPNPALRVLGDLDLLVPRASMMRTAKVLQEMGYQPLHDLVQEEVYFSTHQHLPRFVKAGHASIEIHWTVTTPGKSYRMDVEELWSRAQPVMIGTQQALGLAPEDLLIHLCVHASYQHIFTMGLRNLIDIDVLLRRYEKSLNWTQIVERVQRWHCERGFFLTLAIVDRLLDPPRPDERLTQLRPMDFDECWIDEALQMLLTPWQPQTRVSQSFTEMANAPHPLQKLQIAWKAIFLPPNLMALSYGVAPHSAKLSLYYFVRLKDLLLRYWQKSLRWLQQDPSLHLPAQRHSSLVDWLEDLS